MSYQMNDKQFESVMSLNGPERYKHFISKVTDWEEVYSLRNADGFVLFGADTNDSGIPFWPHRRYAEPFISDDWADCEVEILNLDELIDWLPQLASDQMSLIIFPNLEYKGVVVSPERLKKDIEGELQKYE